MKNDASDLRPRENDSGTAVATRRPYSTPTIADLGALRRLTGTAAGTAVDFFGTLPNMTKVLFG